MPQLGALLCTFSHCRTVLPSGLSSGSVRAFALHPHPPSVGLVGTTQATAQKRKAKQQERPPLTKVDLPPRDLDVSLADQGVFLFKVPVREAPRATRTRTVPCDVGLVVMALGGG